MHELRMGVCYDFRNPPDSGVSDQTLYAEVLEQVRWLDSIGADLVWFTEHHFVEDGYLPSWVPVAGAMAAVTERVRFGTDICLMPFNHPVRLAEDLAVLDNLSGGRVEVGIGMGYAPHEFRGFGLPVGRRVSLMNEGIEVLQRCFTGERFSYHGKRYQLDDVIIKPGYVQEGGPFSVPPLPTRTLPLNAFGAPVRYNGSSKPKVRVDQTVAPVFRSSAIKRPSQVAENSLSPNIVSPRL